MIDGGGSLLNIKSLSLQSNGKEIRVHALRTGTLRLRPPAYRASRPYALSIPRILASRSWGDPLPVGVWVIEHPEGVIVVDTGENVRACDPSYFQGNGFFGWVNGRILEIDIGEDEELPAQLATLGITPDDVKRVVLTHLHVDHTDGLRFLPGAKVTVARLEYEKPIGSVPGNFPEGFAPDLIQQSERDDSPFERCYPVTESGDIVTVPTPGHTPGHQSVIIRTPELHLILAGDTSITQDQMLTDEFPGLTVSFSAALDTYGRIREYCATQPTLYLPTHDPESAERLEQKATVYG